MPTTGRLTPRCSILAMSRGSADSDDEVETISRNSRPRYFSSWKRLTLATSFVSVPSTMTMKSAQVM